MVEEGFCHPTFFEFLFYMAMVLFAREKVDVMVIETGLGGRLDATNVLESPKVCVITSISRDHMQYLGNTIPQIAGEKAGIIKMGVPVVFDDTDKDASAVIGAKAKEMKAVSLPVSKLLYDTEDSSEGILLKEKGEKGLRLSIPFEAPYQGTECRDRRYRLFSFTGSERYFTGITDAVICEGISAARWPGRMEKLQKMFIWTAPTILGELLLLSRQQERSRKEPVKKPGFYLLLWQIKNMKPWQKNFVKVLTGQESVWCI